MESLAVLAVPMAGTLSLLLITLAIALFRQLTKAVGELTKAVAILHTILVGAEGAPGMVDRVQALHDWKNQVTEREAAELRRIIAEMRAERGLE